MNLKIFCIILFVLITQVTVFLCNSSTTFAFDDNDFQYWNQIGFELLLGNDWKIIGHEEFRLMENATRYTHQQVDFGFAYRVNTYFSVGSNFKFVYERDNGEWDHEFRPYVNAWVHLPLGPFTIEDRNRFEYRIFVDGNDWWRYRNRLDIYLPYLYSANWLRPYLANEIFVDVDGGRFEQDRLYAGFHMRFFEHLGFNIFYLRQFINDSASGWIGYNTLGTYFKFLF